MKKVNLNDFILQHTIRYDIVNHITSYFILLLVGADADIISRIVDVALSSLVWYNIWIGERFILHHYIKEEETKNYINSNVGGW